MKNWQKFLFQNHLTIVIDKISNREQNMFNLYKLDGQHIDTLWCLVEDRIEELKSEEKIWNEDNTEHIKMCKEILKRFKKPIK